MNRKTAAKSVLLPLATALLLGCAGLAPAACDLDIRKLGSVVLHASANGIYSPFDPNRYIVIEEFEIEHKGDACDFFVTFSASQTGGYNRTMRHHGAALEYDIYGSSNLQNLLKDIPGASTNEVLRGRFENGKQAGKLQFAIALPPGQFVPPGTYKDRITLTAYEGTLNQHIWRDAKSIQIMTRIDSAIQLSLVQSGGAFDPDRRGYFLDLGELSEGKTAQVDLLVRNNTGYAIVFESENRGMLRHQGAVESDSISYELEVRGIRMRLTGKREQLDGVNEISSLQGDRYPIKITIGSTGDVSAGTYRDNITITVRAD
jgi:spore coat protein U-like protein